MIKYFKNNDIGQFKEVYIKKIHPYGLYALCFKTFDGQDFYDQFYELLPYKDCKSGLTIWRRNIKEHGSYYKIYGTVKALRKTPFL